MTDSYAELYSGVEPNLPFIANTLAVNVPWILLEETEIAINYFQQGKSPGSNVIQGELLKLGLQGLISHLTKSFNKI